MIIELGVTIGSILEANSVVGDQLDVLRVLNAVGPRKWSIELVFDKENRNYLLFSADPGLEEDDFRALLDGRLPSLYAYDRLFLRIRDQLLAYSRLEMEAADKRNTSIDLRPASPERHVGQLMIDGFPSLPSIMREDDLAEWCRNNTWLGSRQFEKRDVGCEFRIIGRKHHIQPGRKIGHQKGSIAYRRDLSPIVQGGEMLGQYQIAYSLIGGARARHSLFGVFKPEEIVPTFWQFHRRHPFSGVDIEVDIPKVEWFNSVGPVKTKQLQAALKQLVVHLMELEATAEYESFLSGVNEDLRRASAAKLVSRQRLSESASLVSCHGARLLKVPSCENELVALYMKLEAKGCLPFDCEVIEYTSRDGIDALADFRLASTGAYSKLAPVEFELVLENYVRHGHVPEQTALIVCWDVGDGPIEGVQVEPNPLKDWLHYLHISGYKIPVVSVCCFPGVKIEKR